MIILNWKRDVDKSDVDNIMLINHKIRYKVAIKPGINVCVKDLIPSLPGLSIEKTTATATKSSECSTFPDNNNGECN